MLPLGILPLTKFQEPDCFLSNLVEVLQSMRNPSLVGLPLLCGVIIDFTFRCWRIANMGQMFYIPVEVMALTRSHSLQWYFGNQYKIGTRYHIHQNLIHIRYNWNSSLFSVWQCSNLSAMDGFDRGDIASNTRPSCEASYALSSSDSRPGIESGNVERLWVYTELFGSFRLYIV